MLRTHVDEQTGFAPVHCAFCQRLDKIYRDVLGSSPSNHVELDRLVGKLWDQYEGAGRARRAYGRRHGYHR